MVVRASTYSACRSFTRTDRCHSRSRLHSKWIRTSGLPQRRPVISPPWVVSWSAEGLDALTGGGLGEPEAVTLGDDDVGMVHEPVDSGGGKSFWHDLVKPGGVQVAADRERAPFVGGVDQPVEALGGVGADREEADVVDDDQVGSDDPGQSAGDGVVGSV